MTCHIDFALVATTGARHREVRAKKAKTFSPVRLGPPAPEGASDEPVPSQVTTDGPAPSPSYREEMLAYHKRHQERDEKQKKKAEERRAKEKEREERAREHRRKVAELKHEFHNACEDIRKETEFWRKWEAKVKEDCNERARRVNEGLPANERLSSRLELIDRREQLKHMGEEAAARLLSLKVRKAKLKAQLAELKGSKPTERATGPTDYHVVLVVVDDRSRYMYGARLLPNETTEAVIAMLREVLPSGLEFLISDNGKQFKSSDFEEFCRDDAKVLHVSIFPHHPNENGRCERPIRTLKDLLELRDWENDEEFVKSLAGAEGEYNHTPHQGIGYLTPAAYHSQGVICQA
jgi:transposase InsO family protein